jgi:cyclophilin family peptidyl-prolyl cis-trans isomerase
MNAKYFKLFFSALLIILSVSELLKAQTNFEQTIYELSPVWNAAAHRDTSALMDYALSEQAHVSDAAMRALTNMDITDVDKLFLTVMSTNSDLWFLPLTTHQLNDDQVIQLIDTITARRSYSGISPYSGLYQALGYQQSEKASAYLLSFLDGMAETEGEIIVRASLPLAISRVTAQRPLQPSQQRLIASLALRTNHVHTQTSWLYGWYRNVGFTLLPETIAYLQEELPELWPELYGLTRQYLIAVLGRNRVNWLPDLLTDDYLHTIHPLEAIEISRILPAVENESERLRLTSALLSHSNQMVRTRVYLALSRMDDPEILRVPQPQSDASIQEDMAYHSYLIKHDTPRACSVLTSESIHQKLVNAPSVLDVFLPLLDVCTEKAEQYGKLITFVEAKLRQPDQSIINRHILNYLSTVLPEDVKTIEAIALLELLAADGAPQLHAAWMGISERHSWILEESEIIRDRVNTAKENAMHRSDELLAPDPDILLELGPAPEWIIVTTRGELRLRLDPLRSPSTVTAIALLTEQRAHEGSPFHRIVPNFVIQAGEIWGTGSSGTPYFRVPTEASEKSFHRGSLGIASAGRDTEGAQFFVMHMWAPHLDGRYTNTGYLIDGYDVLDGLLQGDRVLETRLIPTTN